MQIPPPVADRDPGDETEVLRDFDMLSWRCDCLRRAGYPGDIAVMLAERREVDLHVACRLLENGATIHQALRILT